MDFPINSEDFLPILQAIGITIVSFILFCGIRGLMLRIFSRKASTASDNKTIIIRQLLESTHPFFLFAFSIFLGALWIDLGEGFDIFSRKTAFISFIVLVGLWVNVAINHTIDFVSIRYKNKKGTSSAIFNLSRTICKMLLAATLILFILDNLNFEVSTLIAGLGIGGIALALAVQNILQDLFASLSIIIDKPFLIGDFIIVENYMGSVEYIGIKTTRIRSLSGEQIIFSNGDLLKSRLRNYKKMNERRIAFSLRVVYETPLDKVKIIPGMLKEIIDKTDNVRFGRAHFKQYGTYSLDFDIVYFVRLPDYNIYMDAQQEINESIYERFQAEGIEFAYPTAKSIRIEPK